MNPSNDKHLLDMLNVISHVLWCFWNDSPSHFMADGFHAVTGASSAIQEDGLRNCSWIEDCKSRL